MRKRIKDFIGKQLNFKMREIPYKAVFVGIGNDSKHAGLIFDHVYEAGHKIHSYLFVKPYDIDAVNKKCKKFAQLCNSKFRNDNSHIDIIYKSRDELEVNN